MIHRLVKTTPKPSATKNRSGELAPPSVSFEVLSLAAAAVADAVVEVMVEGDGVEMGWRVRTA